MGVREYDPALGRLISADPLRGNITEPQNRDRYGYVGNNPIRNLDLNGRRGITIEEAEYHWRSGGGTDYDVEMSDLDFTELSEDDFPNGTNNINLLVHGTREAAVFGQLWLTYKGNNQIIATNGFDKYDFNTGGDEHPWLRSKEDFFRNCEATYGQLHAGIIGTDYYIVLHGEGTIEGDGFSLMNTLQTMIDMAL